MKKLFSVLTIITFLMVAVAPIALAAETVPPTATSCTLRHNFEDPTWVAKGIVCPWTATKACSFDSTTNTCGMCCVLDTIYTVTDWIFVGIMTISFIFVIWGAFQIITAGGAAEKVTTGRNYILYAAVGFVIAMIAKAIPSIARTVMGV